MIQEQWSKIKSFAGMGDLPEEGDMGLEDLEKPVAPASSYKPVLERAARFLAVILIFTAGFGLGRVSVYEESRPQVSVYESRIGGAQQAGGSAGASAPVALGDIVASKSGARYHFTWCSGAKQIKEENKIYFKTAAEARLRGYTPASNCPGLE